MSQFVIDLFNLCMLPLQDHDNLIVFVPLVALFFIFIFKMFAVLLGSRRSFK